MNRLLGASLLLLGACDLTQMARDRDTVKALTPAQIQSSNAPTASKPVRVRALVDDDYIAQNRQYEERIRELLTRASGYTRGRFAVEFELVGIERWEHPRSNAIKPLVDQLRTEHPANGAHLVVGFTSALPLFSGDFEDIGAAHLFGSHAVLRGIQTAAVADYLASQLKTVGNDEKDGVVRARVQHQETAVFLHEWGHALGALHDRDLQYFMCPQYRDTLREFSATSVKLIELGLEHVDDTDDKRAWLEAAKTAQLAMPLSAFAPNEREALWSSADGGVAAAAVTATPLSETDRKLFQIAIDKQAAGRKDDALVTALQVQARNPSNPQLSSFICAMSLETKATDPETVKRCRAAASLAPDDPRPQLWLGWALAEQKDLAGARAAADEAAKRVDRSAKSAEVSANLEQLYRRLGCRDCVQQRQQASDMPLAGSAPENDQAEFVDAFNSALTELKAKKPAKAIALPREFPNDARAWELACEAQVPQAQAAARSACMQSLKLDPNLGRAHYVLAVLDEGAYRKADAIAHLEKAIVTDAANVDAWHRLARLYRSMHMTAAFDGVATKYQARFGKPLP